LTMKFLNVVHVSTAWNNFSTRIWTKLWLTREPIQLINRFTIRTLCIW
jgi:hypothetical protein